MITSTRHLLSASIVALAAATAVASTTVAVLEIGKGGVVRRTTSTSTRSNVAGVTSFWSSTHTLDNGNRRRAAAGGVPQAGIPVVPDLFNRADGGMAIGVVGSGVDLASMPTVAGLLEEGSSHAGTNGRVIGHMHLSGKQGLALMEKASKDQALADTPSFGSALKQKVKSVVAKNGSNVLETVAVRVENDGAAAEADKQLELMLASLQKQAAESGSTVVVHLVVEEEEGAARRRLLSRRLDEENKDEEEEDNEEENQDQEEDQEEQDDGNDDNNNNNNNNNNGNNNAQQNGDSSDDSEKLTIFQIQYFNVVLWTSIGLIAVLFYSTALMMNMPLEPDTLLFGQSAKMMGE